MIEIEGPIKHRTFYVVFTDSQHLRPWHLFNYGDWKHCWLFCPTSNNKVIRINALSTYADLDYWDGSPEEVAQEFICEPNVVDIVKITLPLVKKVSYNVRGILNCVTIVKAFMGLNCWWIMTPQQLHRFLKRKGGRSLK